MIPLASLAFRRGPAAAASILALTAALLLPQFASAQATWDDGGGADDRWSTLSNWSDDADPVGKVLTFNTVGAAAMAGMVTSIVDQSIAIAQLFNTYEGASVFHTMQINDGVNLTITGGGGGNAFQLAGSNLGGTTTHLTIRGQTPGSGTLTVNSPTGDFVAHTSTPNATATTTVLDMSGLGTLNATVDEFRVAGSNNNANGRFISQTTLADTNTITANSIEFAVSSFQATSGSFLRLGQTNVFNTDKLSIGVARISGTMEFRSGLTGTPTFTLRDKAGTGRVPAVWLADQLNSSGEGGGNGGSTTPTIIADFTAGSIDWMVTEMHIGNGASVATNNDGGPNATLSFDTGTLDVTTLRIGRVRDNTAAFLTQDSTTSGTLNLGGGSLAVGVMFLADNGDASGGVNLQTAGTFNQSGGTAVITGDLTMARHTSGTPSARLATAALNLTGGTLEIGGSIITDAETTNIDSIVLQGGSLDLTGGAIGSAAGLIETLDFRSGTLRNVAEINGGLSGLVKGDSGNANNTLVIDGTNLWTGGTTVNAGILSIAAESSLGTGNVSVASAAIRLTLQTGVIDAIANTATLSLAGGGAPGVADFGYIELGLGVAETVGTLLFGGIAQDPGIYTALTSPEFIFGDGSLIVVPEPGAAIMLLGGLGTLVGLQRLRHRRS